MISETTFKKILFEGTHLIKKLITNEVDLQYFIKKYANFYHYNALDGHEADEQYNQLLKKYSNAVELHKKIQTNVVDLLYLGSSDSSPEYIVAGRILPDQSIDLITELASSYKIDDILTNLS